MELDRRVDLSMRERDRGRAIGSTKGECGTLLGWLSEFGARERSELDAAAAIGERRRERESGVFEVSVRVTGDLK